MVYTQVILDRRVQVAGVDTLLVTEFCQGPSLSGYIAIPCTGIHAKTATVNEATKDHVINMARRAEAATLFVGVYTQWSWVESSKKAAPSSTLSCAAPVTRPGEIFLTDKHQEISRTEQNRKTTAMNKVKRYRYMEKLKLAT